MGYSYNKNTNQLSTQFSENPEFFIQVSLGKVPGAFSWRQAGALPNIQDNTGFRDIWEFGSTTFEDIDYTYPADNTAPIDTVSSSNVGDTGDVLITGLDIDGKWTQQVVTLNGQTKVTLATPLWRCLEILNLQTAGTANLTNGFAGNIYVYEDTAITGGVPTDTSKVKCFATSEHNISLQSHFTVPAGYKALFVQTNPRIVKKTTGGVTIEAFVRNFGSVFLSVDQFSLNSQGTSTFSIESVVPIPVAGKTDLLLRGDADSNGTGIGTIQNIVMFDEELWSLT